MDRQSVLNMISRYWSKYEVEDLEHHEARFRANHRLGSYYAANYHLLRIIEIKIEQIKRRHCEI